VFFSLGKRKRAPLLNRNRKGKEGTARNHLGKKKKKGANEKRSLQEKEGKKTEISSPGGGKKKRGEKTFNYVKGKEGKSTPLTGEEGKSSTFRPIVKAEKKKNAVARRNPREKEKFQIRGRKGNLVTD